MALSDIYLTTGQAGKLVGVNRLTVRRWVQTGRLTGERVGRQILVQREQLLRLMATRKGAE